MRGFTDAEGCFTFSIVKNKNLVSKNLIMSFKFTITQETLELDMLKELILFFGCGNVNTSLTHGGVFVVGSMIDLQTKVIPFFDKYPLQTKKYYSFLLFKKVLAIYLENKSLLPSNIEDIKKL